MPRTSTARAVRAERVARQGLGPARSTTVAGAVRVTTAVQAQDPAAARLGVWARSVDLTEADTLVAIGERRDVVRTWLMRGTVHLVPAADLRWLVRLIGPSVIGRYRTRWRQLGLHNGLLDASLDLLPEILAGGPLTRGEIYRALAERGLHPDGTDPSLHTHLLMHASVIGLVCRAHDRGRDATFDLVENWLPSSVDSPGGAGGPSGDDALAELARRYFAAYSPATAADFAVWSGLAGARAVALIRDELTTVDLDGRPAYRLGSVEPARGVQLLPAFDNYVIGYKDRSLIVPPDHVGEMYRGGMIRATVLADGAVVGTWRLDRPRGRVHVTPFVQLDARTSQAVEHRVAELARYLGADLQTVL